MTETRGRFITLEGGEGAGKSTQARRLADWLGTRGIDAVATREPGGSPGAEDIRRLLVEGEPGRWLPWTETLLFFAARYDHVERLIKPSLKSGTWVISDRFADSTIAYQGAAGGVPIREIMTLHRLVLGDFQPDLTLILDVSVELGLSRAGKRDSGNSARFERKNLKFHERVRRSFIDCIATAPERCMLIDAESNVEAVAERIRAVVAERLEVAT